MKDRNALINDVNFRSKCSSYGIDWENFEIVGETIVLKTPRSNVYVVLDENYNTIAIPRISFPDAPSSINRQAYSYKKLYSNVNKIDDFTLPYPFQNYSLKQIRELAEQIDICETNNGHTFFINNLELRNLNVQEHNLLFFVKFLNDQVNEYFKNLYQMRMLGFDYPGVWVYLTQLVYIMNKCIDSFIQKDVRPFPVNIMEFFGQDKRDDLMYCEELYCIIDLFLAEKGYKIKNQYFQAIEKTDERSEAMDKVAMKLLDLLPAKEKTDKTFTKKNH